MTDLRCTPLFGSHSADRVTVNAGTAPMLMCGRHAQGITPADYETIRQAEFVWPTPEQFDAASAQGSDRAREQSNAGAVRPDETPLSGEYADSPSPRSVARDVGFILPGDQDLDAVDALADAWEQGYYDTWQHLGE